MHETQPLIYQAPNGAIELRGDLSHETIRLNQAQISEIFGVDRSVITRHIKNIFADDELAKDQVCAYFAQTTKHGSQPGKTQTRQVMFYNLDMVLAVGYRVHSGVATRFRQRATTTLRDHIVQGYTINHERISLHYDAFMRAVEQVQSLTHAHPLEATHVLDLITHFSKTWFSLHAFDNDSKQPPPPHDHGSLQITADDLLSDIRLLRNELIARGEASDLFAHQTRAGGVAAIVGTVYQTAGGADVYPTTLSKAAHLLYFFVKNHPFSDGNKRSGAFACVRYLQRAGYRFHEKITPEALSAITILIATSDPSEKDKIIDLIIMLFGS